MAKAGFRLKCYYCPADFPVMFEPAWYDHAKKHHALDINLMPWEKVPMPWVKASETPKVRNYSQSSISRADNITITACTRSRAGCQSSLEMYAFVI